MARLSVSLLCKASLLVYLAQVYLKDSSEPLQHDNISYHMHAYKDAPS